MKIWTSHGSEHSYSLVLIGHFVDAAGAKRAEEKFERLTTAAVSELPEQGWEAPDPRFSEEMRALLNEMKLYDLGPTDIENFGYDHRIKVDGSKLELTTDEGEIQGFLKLLVNEGARVEIYSSHDWTDEGLPRRDAPAEVEAES